MDWWLYPAVVLAGLACGFINTLAGSGSLITLPLLIFLGLPPTVANGTNRVAILFQNVIAVHGFHRRNLLDLGRGWRLMIPAVLGALLGAAIAVDLNERLMRLAIAVVMVFMLVVIMLKPGRWLREGRQKIPFKPWLEWPVFFAVGVYGGFIQAGVGIFMLAALVLGSGVDLVRANALKVLIILGFTPFALFVFLANDQVVWEIGGLMALGNMTGAWLGTRAAAQKGAPFVHKVLILAVAGAAIKLLWDVFTT